MNNSYKIEGDKTIIYLNKRNGIIVEAIIDTEDLPRAQEYLGRWHVGTYSTNKLRVVGNGEVRLLHRWLLNPPDDKQVDHINHNALDNRRCNLAIVSNQENAQNRRGPQSTNKSGTIGVTWDKRRKLWEAKIKVNYKSIFIGYYKNLKEAVTAREKAELKYFPYKQHLKRGLHNGTNN